MKLGTALHKAMRRMNLSQAELGERFGVSQASVSGYVNPKYDIRLDTALKIANECRYELVIRPKSYKAKEDEEVITNE